MFRERAQMEIAGRHFRPGVGDGHQRTREIGVRQPCGFEHGTSRGTRDPFLDFVTVHVSMVPLLNVAAGPARRSCLRSGGLQPAIAFS